MGISQKLERDLQAFEYGLLSKGEFIERQDVLHINEFLYERVYSALQQDDRYTSVVTGGSIDHLKHEAESYSRHLLDQIRSETGWNQLNSETKVSMEQGNMHFNTIQLGRIKGATVPIYKDKPGIKAKLWRIWGEIVGTEDYAREGHIRGEMEVQSELAVETEVTPVRLEFHVANPFRNHIVILSGYFYYNPLKDTFHVLRERR